MYASEIMPLRTRNKGVALGVSSHWLSNFVVVYVTPGAIDNLGYRLYIIWAVLNASFVPITYFFYPETARRSLEDMDQVFLNERFGFTKCKKPGPRKTEAELDRERDSESDVGKTTATDTDMKGYGGEGNTSHIGMTSTTV